MSFSVPRDVSKPLLGVWRQQKQPIVLAGCLLPAHGQPHCSHTVHRIKQSYAWATAKGRTCWPCSWRLPNYTDLHWKNKSRKSAININQHTDSPDWKSLCGATPCDSALVVSDDAYSLRDDPSQIPPVTWGGKKDQKDHFLHVALCIRPHLRCGFGETGATVLTTDHRAHGILTSNSTCDFAVGLCWAMLGS